MGTEAARGIGRYTEELVRAMLAIAPQHEYWLVTRRAIHPFSSHPSVHTKVADIPWYGFREQLCMPTIFAGLHADILHVPHWNVPLLTGGRLVVTIHDLLLSHEPASARISTRHAVVAIAKRWGFRLNLYAALHKAQAILVPTTFVADDITKLYPFAARKITVTGEGMGKYDRFFITPSLRPPSSKYLLYIGSAYPHKGLDLLIDAWRDVERQHPELHLKIAGADDVFMARLKAEVLRLRLPRVEFLGYVPDEELPALYRDALAFVYPSRFEGFGLPPLEALQVGCPVIASRATALPEVLGEAGAFYFESGSRTGILQAVRRVMDDPEYARRCAAAALPDLRVRHDWIQTAERTLNVYQTLFCHETPRPQPVC